jgi:hypothetical protein
MPELRPVPRTVIASGEARAAIRMPGRIAAAPTRLATTGGPEGTASGCIDIQL